jgi:hemerythrin-like domain-containing protein
MKTESAALHPGSSYEQPFELLSACHDRVDRSLRLLERLLQHLDHGGGRVDETARSAAEDVRRYFNIAAPLHHQDEELHLFPRLRAAGAVALSERLSAEHRELERQWAALDPMLATLPSGPVLAKHAGPFIALMREHLRCEDEELLPACLPLLEASELSLMGREMAARRGLRL